MSAVAIEDVLTKLELIQEDYQNKMIAGVCGGGHTVEGQMVNYRAAVMVSKELGRVIEFISESLKQDAEAAEATFEPLKSDPYEEES